MMLARFGRITAKKVKVRIFAKMRNSKRLLDTNNIEKTFTSVFNVILTNVCHIFIPRRFSQLFSDISWSFLIPEEVIRDSHELSEEDWEKSKEIKLWQMWVRIIIDTDSGLLRHTSDV